MPTISLENSTPLLVSAQSLRSLLQGKLTDAQIDAVLTGAGASPLRVFRAGDLITADSMNYLFTKVADLDARLSALTGSTGSSTAIVITSLEPLAQQENGGVLMINGSNFSSPSLLNKVVLTPLGSGTLTSPVTVPLSNYFQTESSPTRLKLQLPVLGGISTAGVDFTVSVTNAVGDTAQANYHIVAPAGAPPVAISNIEPAVSQAVAQKLVIVGSNFEFPPNLNTVIFTPVGAGATTAVTATDADFALYESQSSKTRLALRIPAITGIPAGGQTFKVRVITLAGGSMQSDYTLLPPLPVTGPPPNIATVTNTAGLTTLKIGEGAVMTGSNFGAAAADNIVKFIFQSGNGQRNEYPVTISSVSVSNAVTTLNFIVPNIAEVGTPASGAALGAISLKVGNNAEVSRNVAVRR